MSEPFDIVIFGGCGDLAFRKLIPALYRGYVDGMLTEKCRIFPTCRTADRAGGYLAEVKQKSGEYLGDEYQEDQWQAFEKIIEPVSVDIANMGDDWLSLADTMNKSPKKRVRVYYLAIPPTIFSACCDNLAAAKMVTPNSRLVVEKPLGYDTESSIAINDKMAQYFPERNIYRIDHYLGKETVQNLFALRFTNSIFEELWDGKAVDHVQITISEAVGLESRAGFYDDAGAMRDMVQNHLLQLLCLVAMESPTKVNAHSIRAEKLKVLEALRPIMGDDVAKNTVRGQYVAGNHNGELVPGYLEELGSPTSNTETFAAFKVHIDNWRWARVPFYLRTGKRMNSRFAEIVIQYKEVSHEVFPDSLGKLQPNRLVIRLQPEESIQLTLMTKDLSTLDMQFKPATLNLNFSDDEFKFKSYAYKRLIVDAAEDNQSLFISREEVTLAWQWIDPIIKYWQESAQSPNLYRSGSWGPTESDELINNDGRQWYNPGEGQ